MVVLFKDLHRFTKITTEPRCHKVIHRSVKQRYYPMRGFGSFASAARFLAAFDELRQYFRLRSINQKPLPLSEQRREFKRRFADLFTTNRVT